MPNPFPGMNPYLEERSGWQGLHNMLIAQIAQALNAVLPPNYVASTEVRCLISHSLREITPDISVRAALSNAYPHSAGGTAVLSPAGNQVSVASPFDTPLIVSLSPIDSQQIDSQQYERQAYINIVRLGRGRFQDAEVVTAIEVLSPTNKNRRDDGYEAYRRKQEQVLSSRANLLEIDLLRAGTHTVAVSRASLPTEPPWHYLICLYRWTRPAEYAVWLNALQSPLPRVEIPLADDDPSVALELQTVLNRTYDAGAYDRQIDYTLAPDPPLQSEDALWANSLLRERGLRA